LSTHKCPAPGCDADVPSTMFACRPHWRSLPKPIRDEVWRAYQEDGALSEAHMAAMEAATAHLEEAAARAAAS
jgi:hypothetical protein